MNTLQQLFADEKRKILSVFFTAGFPAFDSTTQIIRGLWSAGVDLIEVGIPFSDPLADGQTIQHSSEVALKNGMTLKKLFAQLGTLSKEQNTNHCPVLLMGYLNSVFQYGFEEFCKDASRCGISGIILPDLPFTEYQNEYKSLFTRNNLQNVFLITPQTSEERIRLFDAESDGFIYAVSTNSTTGRSSHFSNEQLGYFRRIADMKLRNSLLIGFGVSNSETFNQVTQHAAGAIVGSAFIRHLEQHGSSEKSIQQFVQTIKPLN